MRYYGPDFDIREDTLVEKLKSNSVIGTSIEEIQKFLAEKGFKVTIRQDLSLDDIRRSIDTRDPVLVCFQGWVELDENGNDPNWNALWNDGHYAIIIGYDEVNFYFMDPATLGMYAYIPITEFESRWHDTDGEGETAKKLNRWGLSVSHANAKDTALETHAFYLA
jgi:predicted double-glycine peptidase